MFSLIYFFPILNEENKTTKQIKQGGCLPDEDIDSEDDIPQMPALDQNSIVRMKNRAIITFLKAYNLPTASVLGLKGQDKTNVVSTICKLYKCKETLSQEIVHRAVLQKEGVDFLNHSQFSES